MNIKSLESVHDRFYGLHQLSPRRGCPLNKKEEFNPFFIIGSGRSGNTLLRRILYSHPDIYIPPETYVLGRSIKLFRQNRHLSWAETVHTILAQFEFHQEFETFNISLRPLVNSLVEVPLKSRSLSFILNSFYCYCASESNKSFKRWGDKTPLNTFCLDDILSVFPDAQFIHLVRDGCDASYSYLRSGIYRDIEGAAQRWTDSVKAASKFVENHPGHCFEVRYENLVSKPEESIKQICDFLNIEFRKKMLLLSSNIYDMGDVTMRPHHRQILQPISTNSIGKGRSNLSIEEKQTIERIINGELERLNYEPCTSSY